jgi:hypothetical protein
MTNHIELHVKNALNIKLFGELTQINDLLVDKWSGTGCKTMGRV